MEYENAARFLKSYNRIENQLRILYNARPTQNFTDLVKRCTDLNITVRRYENELIDYGKLRNAIVHTSSGEELFIANPCDNVVENIEYIEKQLCNPPKINEAIRMKKVASVFADKPLLDAVTTFSETWQKTLIVYDHGKMVGVINSYGLFSEIAERVKKGEDVNKFLTQTKCGAILNPSEFEKYRVMSADTTVYDVFSAFEEKRGLLAVIVTENGVMGEKAINMITPTDFPRINRYLESYGVKAF